MDEHEREVWRVAFERGDATVQREDQTTADAISGALANQRDRIADLDSARMIADAIARELDGHPYRHGQMIRTRARRASAAIADLIAFYGNNA